MAARQGYWTLVKWIDDQGIGRAIGIVHLSGASQGREFLAQINAGKNPIRYFLGTAYCQKANAVKAVKCFAGRCELYGLDFNGTAYDVHEVL